jgi:hypothetical protein
MIAEIDGSDPVSQFLHQTLSLTAASIFVATLAYGVVFRLFLPMLTWFSTTPMRFPPSVDGLFGSFIEWPMILAYFLWSRKEIPLVFNVVIKNKLLARETKKEDYESFLKRVEQSFNSRFWFIISATAAVILSGITAFTFWPNNPGIWFEPDKHGWYAFLEIAAYTLAQYVVVQVVIRELLTGIWLGRFFREFEITVLLDYPDKAGGWGEVGKHAAGLSVFVIAMTVWSVAYMYSATPTGALAFPAKVAIWLLFSILAPIGFLLPTLSTHWAMKRFKDTILKGLSQDINLVFIEKGTADSFKKEEPLHQLESMRNWYKMIDTEFPEWPFSRSIFQRLGAAWFLPFLTGLSSTAIDYLLKSFTKS